MNQRVLHENAIIIPQKIVAQKMPTATRAAAPESVMFDKAESAEEMDQWQKRHDALTMSFSSVEFLLEAVGKVQVTRENGEILPVG